jgi:ABC-type multidrug transport system fused ATPase/permease subunit
MILDDGRVRERGLRADLVRDPDSHFSQLRRVGMEDALA